MANAASAQIAAQTPDQVKAYELNYMQTIGTVDAGIAPELATKCAQSDPKAIAAWIAADLSADLRPTLKNATLPLLELMPYAAPSEYTQEQTLAFYQMLLAGAPSAKVVPITGARHFAMIDQPAAVDAAITQFLQSVQ
jgi:pimeloyl-ACP methyl ester carboxylesterase